jgi:hypothetical protein
LFQSNSTKENKEKMQKRFTKLAVALTASLLVAGYALPAQATSFSVSADKTQGLARTGQVVNVTLTGLPENTGVYLRLCAGTLEQVTQARPTNCVGMGETVWVSTNPSALGQGAVALSGAIALKVPSTITSGSTIIDCTQTACGIHVRRDHLGGATDFSLDRFIAVDFEKLVAKNQVVLEDSKVKFTIVKKKGKRITFVVAGKQYNRLAKSNNFVFEVSAPKKSTFKAVATVGTKRLVAKTLTK